MENISDIRKAELIRTGDKAAFHSLFTEYYAPLCRYASIFVKRAEVEDLVQDFFVHIWENRERITVDSSLKAYLYAGVRNMCLSLIRRDGRTKAYQEYIYNKLKDKLEEPDEGYFNDIVSLLSDAIADLPEQGRKVFELSRFTDMTNKQIGESVGLSEKSVEYHITKALKFLREHLKDYLFIILMLI